MIWLGIALAGPWTEAERWRVRDPSARVRLSVEQRAALAALAEDLVRWAPSGTVPASLERRATAQGLSLRVDDGIATLGGPGGWGLLAVRLGPARPWLLQAPHPWYDLGTGALTERLFYQSDARAALFATAHRKLTSTADAAHDPNGGFQALTLGVTTAMARPVVVQVHGFGEGHTGADLVVGGWGADALVDALAPTGWIVARGADVPTLAGRTNRQVRALKGRVPVAHLEIARPLREALRDDPALSQRLVDALARWAP